MERRPGLGRKEDASCELDVVDVVDVVDRGNITISLSKIFPAAGVAAVPSKNVDNSPNISWMYDFIIIRTFPGVE